MKQLFVIMVFVFSAQSMFGQKELVIEKGVVSYVSSLHIYVKFLSTEFINKGDTLYLQSGAQLLPSLQVSDKSSTSCVCVALATQKMTIGDTLVSKSLVEKKPEKSKEKKRVELPSASRDSTVKSLPLVRSTERMEETPGFKQRIKGRISAASYSNIYGSKVTNRMNYTLTYQGNNFKNSRFSADSYISFRHTLGAWDAVKGHLGDALKVYTLAVKYDVDHSSSISLGRKINYRISSMGAIDGVQYEKGFGGLILGAIGGWRPDYTDYGFNPHLFQAGAYVSYTSGEINKRLESTFAFVEQRNHTKTDRRFVYFQHSNTVSKSMNLFASFEVDLYQNINNEVTNKPSLTNLLLSLRYKASKKLNFSFSYDNRKNIIYYESYKSYIDQLIEDETRQGLRLGGNYRFTKLVTCGFNASWRFQKNDLNLSKNINTYLNFNRLPWIKATASLSANILKTNYLDSKIYGVRISKEIIRTKLQSEVYYRLVNYQYKNYAYKIQQHVAGVDLSWTITRELAFYLYYEGTFDKRNKPYSRFNAKIIQRF